MKNAKVLVVDDEKGICDFFQKVLPQEGYEVSVASDGEKGLDVVKKEKPMVVLLDIRMPGMDGVEVLREIKKIDKNIVVIIITAYSTMRTARETMRLGAYDYITKPFNLDYIKALIKDALKVSVPRESSRGKGKKKK